MTSPIKDQSPTELTSKLLDLVKTRGYTRRDEPFQLSSGGFSHDYIDLRRALSRGEDLRLAASAVSAALRARSVAYDAIGGMTMGADPVAHAVALMEGRSWYSVRKAEKSHGTGRRIEGAELSSDTSVVLFEDTISTGGSILEALEVVQNSRARVVVALTILDRGELAKESFARAGIDYFALLTYRDLGIEPIGSA